MFVCMCGRLYLSASHHAAATTLLVHTLSLSRARSYQTLANLLLLLLVSMQKNLWENGKKTIAAAPFAVEKKKNET